MNLSEEFWNDVKDIAKENALEDMIAETIKIQNDIHALVESKRFALDDQIVGGGTSGIYMFHHIPTGTIMYIGRSGSSVSSRIRSHINQFNNDGVSKDLTKDSQCAKKMFEFDSDPTNWEVSYVPTISDAMSRKVEEELIFQINPEFNNISMAGV